MSSTANDFDKEQQPEESVIDIKKIFFKYLSYWKWFVLSIICFVAMGVYYLLITPPQYLITASILIKDEKKLGGGPSAISILEEMDAFSTKKLVDNELEILRSYTLLEEVAKNLNLQVSYTSNDEFRVKYLYEQSPIMVELIVPSAESYATTLTVDFVGDMMIINGKRYPQNALITESFGTIRTTVDKRLLAAWDVSQSIDVNFSPLNAVVVGLRSSIEVKPSGKGTSVVVLSMLSHMPQRGKDILNSLIAEYNKASIADKNNMAGATITFIDERLQLLSTDLQDAEKKVEDYKAMHRITNISAESDLFLRSVQKNDEELNTVSIQLDVLKSVERYVLAANTDSARIAPATLGVSDPTLLSLISMLTNAESERAKDLRTMNPAHPMLQALNDQISSLKQGIIDNIALLRRSLEITQQKLAGENRRLEKLIQSVPKKERELVDITRQREIKDQLYVYLLSKREETAIAYAATVADSRLIDAARSSLGPTKPSRNKVLLIFALVGFLLPIGVIIFLDFWDDKISSKEEAEKKIKAPFLGEISLVKQANKALSAVRSKGKQAEQIRSLRTNLAFMQAGGGIKTILVTSSVSGEGKSFLTANLGVAFAALGKKVVVLGFDLRKPGLHKMFGIDNEEGLSNYLAGQAGLDQVIRTVEGVDNLNIISCGHIPPNPQELLLGPTLPLLFDELRRRYDCIIIDTPPVAVVSDALILDQQADVTLFVVRQNYTPKDRMKDINELYTSKKMKRFGVVVNGVEEEKWYGYYGYYYYGKSYYGKYYTEDQPEKRTFFKRKKKQKKSSDSDS